MDQQIEQPSVELELFEIDPPAEIKPRVGDVIRRVARENGVTFDEIIGPLRPAWLYTIRQFAMWRARVETGRSLPEIGRVFNRDHTTVMHAIRKFEAMSPEERNNLPKRPAPPPPKPVKIARPKASRRATEFFVPDQPCRRGHQLRYVENGRCVYCSRLYVRKARLKKEGQK